MRIVNFIIAGFFIFTFNSLQATQVPVVDIYDSLEQIRIEKKLLILKAKDGDRININDSLFNGNFTLNSLDEIFLDYKDKNVYWIKFTVKNHSKSRSTYLLEIANPTINKLHFFEPDEKGGHEVLETGDSYPFSSRRFKSRIFLFELKLHYNEEKTFYLFANTEGDKVNFPIAIWQNKAYTEKAYQEQYVYGIFFGILFLIILLHFFLYFNLKDITHIYYVLYVAGLSLIMLSLDGLFFQYFSPELPLLADRLLVFSVYFTMLFLIVFTQMYLDTKKTSFKYHHFLNLFLVICFTLLIFTLCSEKLFYFALEVSTPLAPIINLAVISAAFVNFKNNKKLSFYFILAFALLIFGVTIAALKANGLLAGFPLKDYGFKVGIVAEIITLSFALTVRFKMMQEEIQALALDRLEKLNQMKDEQNVKLENMVQARTLEINQQKEIIEKKNIKITHSILYAKRIQDSLLPDKESITDFFPESFILFKPKDIVSGDFYWFTTSGDMAIIALVDCTGHGIPGAFMSMLGSSLLNQIVKINGITQTDEILNHLNNGVRLALKQNNGFGEAQDGMDIAICSINYKTGSIQFSGAKRPLYYLNNEGDLTIFPGNKFPIGGSQKLEIPFENSVLELVKGNKLYLFTDGYIDQFGSEKDIKFMSKNFREILCKIYQEPMHMQEKMLNDAIEDWKGTRTQTDDILVMGIKL